MKVKKQTTAIIPKQAALLLEYAAWMYWLMKVKKKKQRR